MDPSADEWRFCPLCAREFTSDVKAHPTEKKDDEENPAVPLQSATCSHVICLSCVEQHAKAHATSNNQDEENQSSFLNCPICNKENAFDERNPIKSLMACNMVKIINQLSSALATSREQNAKNSSLQQKNMDLDPEDNAADLAIQQDCNGATQEAKVGRLKYEPETVVFEGEPSAGKLEAQHSISNERMETMVQHDKSKSTLRGNMEAEAGSTATAAHDATAGNSGGQQSPVRPTARPSDPPGAYPVEGPHFNSSNDDDEDFHGPTANSEEILVHATLVEETPPPRPDMYTAYAEPLLSFRQKYKWPLRGLALVAIVVTVVVLAIEVPKVKRNNSLTSIVLSVSNQKNIDELGVPQRLAMNWVFGTNNTHYDAIKQHDRIAQRYVLATLFYSTHGENWTQNANMLSFDDECKWYERSLICSEDGSVVAIKLESNNLQGSLSTELGYLKSLQELALGNNNISGALVSELGILTELRELNLTNNIFAGEIPSNVGELTRLNLLDLSQNNLVGSIPTQLGQLEELKSLKLSSNKLYLNIPTELGNIQPPVELQLSKNILTGEIPSEIGRLQQLITLDVSSNELAGTIIPQEFMYLTKLTSLDLHDNQLSAYLNEVIISNLDQLAYLDMSLNMLYDTIPSQMGLLTRLTVLNLNNNLLSGAIPTEFGQLTQLKTLRLSSNKLSGTIPTQIGNCVQLQQLALYSNALSGPIPKIFGTLKNLQEIYLEYNQQTSSPVFVLQPV